MCGESNTPSSSTDDIIRFIDYRLGAVLAEPRAYVPSPADYVPSPDALESYLMLLDEIKEYAKFGTTGGGIIEFLRESGFGAAAICSRSRTDGENATDSVLVTRIVQVWKTYLSGAIRFELNTVQNPATG